MPWFRKIDKILVHSQATVMQFSKQRLHFWSSGNFMFAQELRSKCQLIIP